jgi:hypothetical protein
VSGDPAALRNLSLAVLLLAGSGGTAGVIQPTAVPKWEPEVRLTNSRGASLLTFNFARSIAADESGNVHVVWYDSRGGTPQVYYKRSSDGGENWGPDTPLTQNLWPSEHPAVAVAGSQVYVVWHEVRGGGPNVYFRRSSDSGASWSPSVPLTDGHSSAHASIAVAGSDVHVVWGDGRDGHAEIYGRRSENFGDRWEPERRLTDLPFESWVPTVALSGKAVLLAWVDLRDGNEEEYVKLSPDGGRTWGPDTRLTSDGADSWAPSVAMSKETFHLVWFDRRDAGLTHGDVERKLDEIMAFVDLPVRPAPPPDPFVYYLPAFLARIQEKLGTIQAVAPDWVRRGGDPQRLEAELRDFESRMSAWSTGWEIYYKRSRDGGATWSPDLRLTTAPDVSARPSLTASGHDLWVVWYDGRDADSEIYFKHSPDGGQTWSGDVRLTDAAGESAHPTLAVGGNALHVVWHDGRHGDTELYYRRARIGRKTLLPPLAR